MPREKYQRVEISYFIPNSISDIKSIIRTHRNLTALAKDCGLNYSKLYDLRKLDSNIPMVSDFYFDDTLKVDSFIKVYLDSGLEYEVSLKSSEEIFRELHPKRTLKHIPVKNLEESMIYH